MTAARLVRVAVSATLLALWLTALPSETPSARALSLCAPTVYCATIQVHVEGSGGTAVDDQDPHVIDCTATCEGTYSWAKTAGSMAVTLTYTPDPMVDVCKDITSCGWTATPQSTNVLLTPGAADVEAIGFEAWDSMTVTATIQGNAAGTVTDDDGGLDCHYAPGGSLPPCQATYRWDFALPKPTITIVAQPATGAIACIELNGDTSCAAPGKASFAVPGIQNQTSLTFLFTFNSAQPSASPAPSARPSHAPTPRPSATTPPATIPAATTPSATAEPATPEVGTSAPSDGAASGVVEPSSALSSGTPGPDASSASSATNGPPVAVLALVVGAFVIVVAGAFLLGRAGRAR